MAKGFLNNTHSNDATRDALLSLALGFAASRGFLDAFCDRFAVNIDFHSLEQGLNSPAQLGDLLETARDPERREAFLALIDGSLRHQGMAALSTTQRFTPPWIAQWLVEHALRAVVGDPLPCLDPACGGGRLLIEAYHQLRTIGHDVVNLLAQGIVGFDLDPLAAEVSRWSLWLVAAEEVPLQASQLPLPLVFSPSRSPHGPPPSTASLGALASLDDLSALSSGWLEQDRFGLVLSNPPYMGSRHMSPGLRQTLRAQFGVYAGDLYTAFLDRCLVFCRDLGGLGVLCQQSFLFLKRDRALRQDLFERMALRDLLHLGPHAFDGIVGEKVSVVAFSASRRAPQRERLAPEPTVVDLSDLRDGEAKRQALLKQEPRRIFRGRRALAHASRGDSFAYWWPDVLAHLRDLPDSLGERAEIPGSANKTANNKKYLQYWWEVSPQELGRRWVPYAKGGAFCKWSGNLERVVDWSEEARDFYRDNKTSNLLAERFWYREGITYSDFGGRAFSARWLPPGSVFDMAGPAIFVDHAGLTLNFWLGFLNSPLVCHLLNADNPTIHYQVANLRRLPIPGSDRLKPDNPHVMKIAKIASEARDLTRRLAKWEPTDPGREGPLLLDIMAQSSQAETLSTLVDQASAVLDRILLRRDRLEQSLALEVEALYGVSREAAAGLDWRYRPPRRRAPVERMLLMDALDFTVAELDQGLLSGDELWGPLWPALRRYEGALSGYRWKRSKKRDCHPARSGSLWG